MSVLKLVTGGAGHSAHPDRLKRITRWHMEQAVKGEAVCALNFAVHGDGYGHADCIGVTAEMADVLLPLLHDTIRHLQSFAAPASNGQAIVCCASKNSTLKNSLRANPF